MSSVKRHSRLVLVACLILCFTLTACRQPVDLQAVQTFAKTADDLATVSSVMTPDFYASCIRRVAREASNQVIREPSPSEQEIKKCSEQDTVSQQWANANDVLVQYVRGLGELAGASAQSQDYGLPNLATQAKAAGIFTQPQADAVKTFANDALNVIFANRRKAGVAEALSQADSALGAHVAVVDVVADKYDDQLHTEADQLDRFYHNNLVRIPVTGLARIEAVKDRQEWADLRKTLAERRSAVVKYKGVLQTIKDDHHALTTPQVSVGATLQNITAQLNQLVPDIQAIIAAYK